MDGLTFVILGQSRGDKDELFTQALLPYISYTIKVSSAVVQKNWEIIYKFLMAG